MANMRDKVFVFVLCVLTISISAKDTQPYTGQYVCDKTDSNNPCAQRGEDTDGDASLCVAWLQELFPNWITPDSELWDVIKSGTLHDDTDRHDTHSRACCGCSTGAVLSIIKLGLFHGLNTIGSGLHHGLNSIATGLYYDLHSMVTGLFRSLTRPILGLVDALDTIATDLFLELSGTASRLFHDLNSIASGLFHDLDTTE